MAIVVTVVPNQPVVTIKANGQGSLGANSVTVGVTTAVGSGGGASNLKDLLDVNTANAQNGDTLIYQSNNQTFVSGPVDGGSF